MSDFDNFLSGYGAAQQMKQNALAQQVQQFELDGAALERIARGVIGSQNPARAYQIALGQLPPAMRQNLPEQWGEEAEIITRTAAMPKADRLKTEQEFEFRRQQLGDDAARQWLMTEGGLVPNANVRLQQGNSGVPSGYRRGANGLEIIPGGPADPDTIRQQAEARQTDEFERITDPNTGRVIFERGTGTAGPSQKLTERQSQLVLFGNQMQNMQPILDDLETRFDPANVGDAAAAAGGVFGNFVKSQEKQLYDTAAAAWAEGVLRIQTGAAATQPEIDRVVRTYFAQPGDTAQTVQFKRQARETFFESIAAASGGAVEAPAKEFSFEGISDDALLKALGQ